MKNIFASLTIIFIVLNPIEAKAVSPNSIIKFFQGFKKIFTKGVDEIPDLGKKIEDLKVGKNLEEVVIPPSNLDDAKNFSDEVLSQTQELDNLGLLDAHNVKRTKEKNIDQLFDVVDSLTGESVTSAIIYPFIQTEWQGKVFRSSKIFNKPNFDSRILLKCETNLEDFYFTALFNKKKGEWFLLSGNFTNKKQGIYKPKLRRQELLVLEDSDEYLYFSNKPKGIKKFPNKYFLINSDAKFILNLNIDEKIDPDISKKEMFKKIKNTNFFCSRIL
jgi:hypothetical protein|tara:strand:- start:7310 stop:8131 length:822 start_codon:yes stop_codon:yes gene_type:complete